MQNYRHYPKAPITEALIDFRVIHEVGISLEKLKKFGAEIVDEYPNEATRDLVQGKITLIGPQPQHQSSRSTFGYIFHSQDRLQAVQARLDGFTFSRFAPYKDWDHLTTEAKRLWQVYVDLLKPSAVIRLAVRYVNQINLPLIEGTVRFEDYLSTFITTGVEDDVNLEQFLVRLVMPQEDLGAVLVLTEALLPSRGDHLSILLDIDLFRENVSFDVRSNEIWDILNTFRSRKNRFFEGSITDATRRLFT